MKRLTLLLLLAAGPVFGEAPPTVFKDVAYDDDNKAQGLDVYLGKSDHPLPAMIYIHGGGWSAGSKSQVPGDLLKGVRDGWLSVVSVEYRFTDVATHPAQVNDCLRAVQFVRQNAAKWKIDPERIGVIGGSAGGHLSLYVAMHDDIAKEDATDPVERQSSRVQCAVSFAGPTDWGLLGSIAHVHPAYRQLLGYAPGTPAEEMDAKKKEDVSPISFASKDDPAILLIHGDADVIVPLKHAEVLQAKATEVGMKSELMVVKKAGHNVGGKEVEARVLAFIKEQLTVEAE